MAFPERLGMSRYLSESEVVATLVRKRAIEQFLRRFFSDGVWRIEWIEIRPAPERFEVRRFEVDDLGDSEFADLYEWVESGSEPDLFVFDAPEDAVEFTVARLDCSCQCWVNQGLVQDEYLDAVTVSSHLNQVS